MPKILSRAILIQYKVSSYTVSNTRISGEIGNWNFTALGRIAMTAVQLNEFLHEMQYAEDETISTVQMAKQSGRSYKNALEE